MAFESHSWPLWVGGLAALVVASWQAVWLPLQALDLADPRLTLAAPDAPHAAHIVVPSAREGFSYFFSVGDFGVGGCEDAHRNGREGGFGNPICRTHDQVQVAEQMARLASGLNPAFVLSLGDSFYERGVVSLDDTQFNRSFEEVYDRGALSSVEWRVALGDHDHRGNVTALLLHSGRSPRWRLPAPYYTFDVPTPSGRRHIQVVVCDSVGLEGAASPELVRGRRFHADYSEEFAGRGAAEAQWSWLEETLGLGAQGSGGAAGAPTPALRLVVGHRPVLSSVTRARTESDLAVMARLGDLLQRASRLLPVVYLHGHDHAMQHFVQENGSLQHVCNGVGGMILHPLQRALPAEFRWGHCAVHGFAVHELGENMMALHFVSGKTGQVLHSVNFSFAS